MVVESASHESHGTPNHLTRFTECLSDSLVVISSLKNIGAWDDPQLKQKQICAIRAASLVAHATSLFSIGLATTYAIKKFIEGDNSMGWGLTACAVGTFCFLIYFRRKTTQLENEIDPNRKNSICEKILFRC